MGDGWGRLGVLQLQEIGLILTRDGAVVGLVTLAGVREDEGGGKLLQTKSKIMRGERSLGG